MNRFGLLLIALLSACTATGSNFDAAEAATKSQVIVYRPFSVVYFTRGFPISVNGEDICKLSNAGFITVPVTSKKTIVSGSLWDAIGTSSLSIDTSKPQTYYVKVEFGSVLFGFAGQTLNGRGGPFIFTQVVPEQAIQELKELESDCQ